MKTLKEFLEESYKQGLKEKPHPTNYEWISRGLELWLKQEQENLNVNWSGFENGYTEDSWTAAQYYMIDNLIEGIKECQK